jgi:iron complex outermembrane receptor protein
MNEGSPNVTLMSEHVVLRTPREGMAARAAVAAALMLGATQIAAAAQEETPTSAMLEVVIVTAQKREQNARDVGISISALSGSDLKALGAATDITRTMPAVILTQPNGPSSFSLSIRGVKR